MENIVHNIVDILYAITIISVIFVIISENRNPVKSGAWILMLIFLPVVGLILYFFIGQDFTKMHAYMRKKYDELDKGFLEKIEVMKEADYPKEYVNQINLLKNIQEVPLLGGNDLMFFSRAEDKFKQMFTDFEKAKKYIHLEYYAIGQDKLGNALKDLLIKKAKEGVEVRIIYDDWGCWRIRKGYFEEMRAAGIQVCTFSKVRIPLLTAKLNYRDHRKIAIIDGEIGYIGGMNATDRYIEGFKWGRWADTHCRVHGRGALELLSVFFSNWYYLSREHIDLEKYYPVVGNFGNTSMQIVCSGPTSPEPEIMHGMTQAFYGAKKSIFVQTPYFIPPESMGDALQAASIRGLDVRLMISKRSDLPLVQLASRSYIKEMLENGVKVYLYKEGFLHSKMMVIDGSLTLMGSANFDIRSFEENLEVEAFFYGEEAAAKPTKIFLDYQKDCEQVTLEEWEKRPLLSRLAESVMRLLAPLL